MTDQLIHKELDEIQEPRTNRDPTEYVTTSGVVLRLRKVSSFIVMDAAAKINDPVVPKVMNDDKGREEENPLDPDYRRALEAVSVERGRLAANVYLGLGTEVVEVPSNNGIQALDSDAWIADLEEMTNLEVPRVGKRRYVAWLKYYILTDSEMNRILQAVQRLSGTITEDEVQDAVNSFRSDEARPTPE